VTPQEQQLLVSLTQRVNQTQLQEKDPDAENLLGKELGANPDALYILAQTVLVQEIALQQAKVQVQQLQLQLQQAQQHPQHASSFLGRIFGDNPQPVAAPPLQAPPPPQQAQAGQGWQPVPQVAPPQYAPGQHAQPQYVAVPSGPPSFLRGAMQTAAGVAAGALAFEGVESILHGFGHGGYGPGMGFGGAGFGMGPGMGMGGGFERPVEETVVNNYYDQPGTAGAEHHFDAGAQPFGDTPHFHESAGQFDQGGARISDAGYHPSPNDFPNDPTAAGADPGNYGQDFSNDSVTADTSVDNMQIDDSAGNSDDGGGGFDDGGGGFDSGGDSGSF
jgi:hypothetical protein